MSVQQQRMCTKQMFAVFCFLPLLLLLLSPSLVEKRRKKMSGGGDESSSKFPPTPILSPAIMMLLLYMFLQQQLTDCNKQDWGNLMVPNSLLAIYCGRRTVVSKLIAIPKSLAAWPPGG